MIVSDFINRVNRAYRGFEEDAPITGTDEWDYWLDTANRKKDEWAKDTKQKWASLWQERSLGLVTVARTYNMAADFIKPSDEVIVLLNTNNRIYFNIQKPQLRGDYYRGFRDEVYFSGQNPVVLTFNREIPASDQIVGGTLLVPAYYLPADMVGASDTIQVDDPNWLVMATASELAFNDTSYVEKYDDLNIKANALYLQMINANRTGTATSPRRVPTMNPMIGRNTFMPKRTRSDQ